MKFVKLDVNKHDLALVSKLIYETELESFKFLFGSNKNNAQKNIQKLIMVGNNSFGSDKIHVVSDENDDVLGILVSYSNGEIKEIDEIKAFFNAMGIIDFLKLLIISPVLNKLLITNKSDDDYYLSNISVAEEHQGKGIGTSILENSFKIAKEKKCKKVVLDVSIDNEGALKLYKRAGFNVYNKKIIKWRGEEIGTFSMEYSI
jgi:ribosomal protein S18 acetylase RimI-like enzyme